MGSTPSSAPLEQLWELEERFWRDGVDVYRERLAEQALVVVPGAVLDHDATVEAIAGAPRWTSVEMADLHSVEVSDDVVTLVYAAHGTRDDAAPYRALISSTYVRRDGSWWLVHHQQTPLSEDA